MLISYHPESISVNECHQPISNAERIAMMAYTARQMESLTVVADFASRCDSNDYEIWMHINRDKYTQPEIAALLDITRAEVLSAVRRVERTWRASA